MFHYYRIAGWARERQHEQRRLAEQIRQAERARLVRMEQEPLAGLGVRLSHLARRWSPMALNLKEVLP